MVDWLKTTDANHSLINPFNAMIMSRGCEFETEVVKLINQKTSVIFNSLSITPETVARTQSLMMQGVPIIHCAPVENTENHTRGIIDLLVRSDYLNSLVSKPSLTEEEETISAPTLKTPYHYVVVDIKFASLCLRADGKHLLNSGSFPAYKAQCLIYTQAVGKIQGYTSSKSFILGRSWSSTERGIKYSESSCFDKLGVIDYDGVDNEFRELTATAVTWIKDVTANGHTWTVASRPELYPNLCVDGDYSDMKKRIATKIDDITLLWNCGVKHRASAFAQGISSWRDERCTAEVLGMSGNNALILNQMLSINRSHDPTDLMRPAQILNHVHNWRDESANDMFVDFEKMNDVFGSFSELPVKRNTDMIFMIGVYHRTYSPDGELDWSYRCFTSNEATHEEEFRIMNEFVEFVNKHVKTPKLWYWFAENNFWKSAESRQFDLAFTSANHERIKRIGNWRILNWVDLRDVFIKEPIVIKNCFSFGLKAIAGAMKKHGMITAELDSDCKDGLTAMVNAWELYTRTNILSSGSANDPVESQVMKDIIKYNRFDVVSLWDILRYIRSR